MTIDNIDQQKPTTGEEKPMTVQMEVQKEVLRQNLSGDNTQNQLLQLLASVQPQQQIQKTAQEQIEKGYLDIKV